MSKLKVYFTDWKGRGIKVLMEKYNGTPMSVYQIATELGVTPNAVRAQIYKITRYRKTHVIEDGRLKEVKAQV